MNTNLDDVDIDCNHFNVLYPDLNEDEYSKYYHAEEFKKLNINDNTDLLMLNFNIRSLSANFDLFHGLSKILNKRFGIISFTESWLTNNNKQLYKIPGYSDFHSLRTDGRRGGGLSIYISNEFDAKLISHSTISLNYIETLFIEIEKGNTKILVALIYKPPHCVDNQFIDKLTELIHKNLNKKYKEVILTGDFNYNLLNYENDNNVMYFMNSLTSLSFVPVITKPTRISDHSATLLDNIYLLNPQNFTSGIIINDISDHLPIFIVKYKIFSPSNPNNNIEIQYRVINENTIENLCNTLYSYDFSDIENSNNCSESLDKLTEVINNTYRTCCPIINRTISYKSIKKPWITKDIIHHIKKRQNYYILYRKNIISKEVYQKYRNFVTLEIRKSKIKYYNNKFEEVKRDIKQTWRLINNVLKPKSNKQNVIRKIVENDVTYVNSKEIGDKINDFFVNIGRNIAESVGSEPRDHLKFLKHVNQTNSFFFRPVTSHEISNMIKSLKNKSSNINTCPIKILKIIANIISIPLSIIINNSFKLGEFPDSLKEARVTPLFKEGDKTKINNYRPISVLPTLSKIFEKVAHKQLYQFLEINSILDQHQYGFRTKRSTTQAIINLTQYLYKNLDSNKIIFSIFLDFRKAFDSVDHGILLSKLNVYGVRGLAHDWFRSYLSNRKQFVHINNTNSDIKPISHGVPQGSILGPLLFLVFINDIAKSSNFFKYILYADDSTLSTCINDNNIRKFAKTVNLELRKVHLWLSANNITINKDKTKYILFSYNKKIKLPKIKIGNNIISETTVTKFLGIHIDKNLTFKSHISEISLKLSKTIGLLYKLNKFLPINILKIIYQSIFQPYLNYGIEAWHATVKNHTNKIFILQKKAIRAINNLDYNEHTNEYFKSNHLLKLDNQFQLQTLIYIYKSLNLNFDEELSSRLNQLADIHDHNTKSCNKLNITRVNRSKSKNLICHNGIKLWNILPENIRNSRSLYIFRKKTKIFYLDQY